MCNPQAVWVTWGYIRLAPGLLFLTRGPVVAWLPLSCHGHMHTIEDDLIFWKASLTTSLLFVSEKLKSGTLLVVGYHLYMHTSILTWHLDMTGTILSAICYHDSSCIHNNRCCLWHTRVISTHQYRMAFDVGAGVFHFSEWLIKFFLSLDGRLSLLITTKS